MIARLAFIALSWTLCVGSTAAGEPCRPVEGFNGVLARSNAIIVMGEYHGTTETPALFGDMVCQALATGARVNVALELPASATPELRAFLQETGPWSAVERKVGPLQDGRGSVAMGLLVEELRSLAGDDRLQVTAIQPEDDLEGSAYEQAMASAVVAGATETGATITLVLVGNVHAMRAPAPQAPDLAPMASFLPSDQTLTFNTAAYLGQAWACRRVEGEDLCKAWPLAVGTARPREIWFSDEPGGLFDGRYSVGAPFTASPPAQVSNEDTGSSWSD